MTEFMLRIHGAIRGGTGPSPVPAVQESTLLTVGQGAHEQVENRAYAEQLVCEANGVLAASGLPTVTLEDQCGTLDQVFTVRAGEHWATFATRIDRRGAISELVGSSVPADTGGRLKLAGEEGLEDFLVGLVSASAADHRAHTSTRSQGAAR